MILILMVPERRPSPIAPSMCTLKTASHCFADSPSIGTNPLCSTDSTEPVGTIPKGPPELKSSFTRCKASSFICHSKSSKERLSKTLRNLFAFSFSKHLFQEFATTLCEEFKNSEFSLTLSSFYHKENYRTQNILLVWAVIVSSHLYNTYSVANSVSTDTDMQWCADTCWTGWKQLNDN